MGSLAPMLLATVLYNVQPVIMAATDAVWPKYKLIAIVLNAGVGMIPANDRVATVHGRRERPQGGGGRGGGLITMLLMVGVVALFYSAK